MRKPLPMLSQLFFSFMKVGLFTFGGGYAMISVITDTCVEKKRWLTQDEMMDLTVVAESTPGPIAINCATYVGYKMAGMTGAVLATLCRLSAAWRSSRSCAARLKSSAERCVILAMFSLRFLRSLHKQSIYRPS